MQIWPELTSRDVQSLPMGCPGEDIILSEKAAEVFPFSVEAKNQENISIWKVLDQASQENRKLTPLLIFKRNRSKVYVALEFDDFLNILNRKNNTI